MFRKTILILLGLFPALLFADWQVDPEGSYIGFASVKNDLIVENHSFTQVTEIVSKTGEVRIKINLASVETLIPIRNERMQSMLFEIATYPTAEVKSLVDVDEFTSLAVGENKMLNIDMTVDLHATQLKKSVLVKVTRSSDNSFEVTSLGPIVVHASQFSMAEGVEALRKIAGLQSIDLMVPVTFDVRLVAKQP